MTTIATSPAAGFRLVARRSASATVRGGEFSPTLQTVGLEGDG